MQDTPRSPSVAWVRPIVRVELCFGHSCQVLVVPGVVRHGVALGDYAINELGLVLGQSSQNEERGSSAVASEDVEHLGRVAEMRAVIQTSGRRQGQTRPRVGP